MGKTRLRTNRRPSPPSRYTQKTLLYDREFGFFWYAWLWKALRPVLVLSIGLIIVAGVAFTGWNYVYGHFFMPVDATDTRVREFVIDPGTALSTIGVNLQNQGFVRNSGIFKYIVQFQELTGKIHYGSYPLSSGMDVNEVIKVLARGVEENERSITIIPGWTIEDIADYLFRQGAISSPEGFRALCNNADQFRDTFAPLQDAADAQALAGRKYALEGYLAPDTYRVYSDAQPEAIIEKLLSQSEAVYDEVFNTSPVFETTVDEEGNLLDEDGEIIDEEPVQFETTLTRDQTVILASLIEKEAGKIADYRKVSAVFHNRLQKEIPLESDASVAYALSAHRLVLTAEELRADTPYNTYQRQGLPAGPICNPSQSALTAALYPDMDYLYDDYLYFCAGDPAKGELIFSKTKEEHEAAVEQYRPLWVQYDQNAAS